MADRGDEARSILTKALEQASLVEREAYLKEACGPDSVLLDRVRTLLKAFAETAIAPHDLPADLDATTTFPERPRSVEDVGSMIGPYKLLRKIGEGGFGMVYLAEQQEPVRRRVALKLMRFGADEDGLVGRFEAERQALALMDHPNIARIFDAGATEAGRLFFVMELVEGIPITEYGNQRQLGIRQRLELFVAVCHAIQHAHQKGIIHRDIKPSNVLVTVHDETPVPKVIDFGIAKATQRRLTDRTVYTEMNQLIGTPAYMSPEQVEMSGLDIDTRSDIYALGVLLYELLTDTVPFQREVLRRASFLEFCRIVREQEPPKPSVRLGTLGETIEAIAESRGTDPSSLRKHLRGDLDWIVMKCLEKDRARRYETANGLAMDVRRHLADEPVLAGPPSALYRFRKFAVRHRGPVIAATAVLVALAAGLITSLLLWATARERAREVFSLSDVKVLTDLKDSYDDPIRINYLERHDRMRRWIERAEELVARLERHRSVLDELRRKGRRVMAPPVEPAKTAGARPASSVAWTFDDTPTQWHHDSLQQLVRELEAFRGSTGLLPRHKDWITLTPTPEEIDRRWKEAAASITAEYGGLRLARRGGLFPLGRGPRSGLWRFVDLTTGLAPRRESDGRLVVGEEAGIVFVLIPGGRFLMGSPEGEPGRKLGEDQHQVVLSPFLISKYEVTQAQWKRLMGYNESRYGGPNHPADSVRWDECREFCRRTGLGLPTEAQWEFACRAGTTGPYSGTGSLEEMGWYGENAAGTTHPVGQKAPNQFGLFDVHGNLLEWCQDLYSEGYYRRPEASGLDPVNDEHSPERGPLTRVLRGGSFQGKDSYCRSADRYWGDPLANSPGHGLRPVWPIR